MKTIIERGASWTLEETKMLLALWGQDLVQRQQTNTKRTKEVYEKISEKFNQNGFERTADQVRTRVFNMIAEYRRILKDPNVERIRKCIFFEALHRIYQAKHMDDVKSALDDYEPEYPYSPISNAAISSEKGDESVSDSEATDSNETINNSTAANTSLNAANSSASGATSGTGQGSSTPSGSNSTATPTNSNTTLDNNNGDSNNANNNNNKDKDSSNTAGSTSNPYNKRIKLEASQANASAPSASSQHPSTSSSSVAASSHETTTTSSSSSSNNNNNNNNTTTTNSSSSSSGKQAKTHQLPVVATIGGSTVTASASSIASSSASASASSSSSSHNNNKQQSLLMPHASTSSSASSSGGGGGGQANSNNNNSSTPMGKLTATKGATSTPSYININSTKLPIIRTNQLIGHSNRNDSLNLNGTTATRLPTTAPITSHQLYQAPVNTFDVTSSALLIDRMFAHLSRESENMREWIALEKERLALERARRQQDTEREVRRERVLIDTLMRFQDQWLSFLSQLDPRIIENHQESLPELRIPPKEATTTSADASQNSATTQPNNTTTTSSSSSSNNPTNDTGNK